MRPLFKKITEADAAIKENKIENPDKIITVEIAAKKLSNVLTTNLADAHLHTTTRRFIERETKLQNALFLALEEVLEVKNYAHYLRREDLEKLRNSKISTTEVNKILETFNIGLVVYHAKLINTDTSKYNQSQLEEHAKKIILMSQMQEIVATYLSLYENNSEVDFAN